jgi:hypothetical protein
MSNKNWLDDIVIYYGVDLDVETRKKKRSERWRRWT